MRRISIDWFDLVQDRHQWRVLAKKRNETLDSGQTPVAGSCEKRNETLDSIQTPVAGFVKKGNETLDSGQTPATGFCEKTQ
jgi:hypothetical protein